jgi:hypothetical protein
MSMTDKQYEERNLKGFEDDRYIKAKLSEIIQRRKIDTIVETGTYLGGTTKVMSQMVKRVITTEINPDFFRRASIHLKDCDNVMMYHSDTMKVFPEIIESVKKKNVIYYLDDHWLDHCPLKDELKAIADAGIKPVIVIHDWLVPGTDFGYDSYKGQPFTWEWIEKDVFNIYGDQFIKYYNTMAEGAKRGVLYIEPK